MGKLQSKELEQVLSCIKPGPSVIVPPRIGFNSGVHKIRGGLCVAVSTDPCLGVPRSWLGWLLIHYAASDVAVFGVEPRYCAVNLLGPPGTKKQLFQTVMRSACKAASELGMSIVTGHTGRYEALQDLIGTCTAYGFARSSRVKTPADARPGDKILCTKLIGLETLATFSRMRETLAKRLLGESRYNKYRVQFKYQSCVKEALALSTAPAVHALHDVAEGGLVAALNEIGRAANLGFTVDLRSVPFSGEVQDLARYFRLSWQELISISSTGSLVVALRPDSEAAVLDRLARLGIPASVVGRFSKGDRRTVRGDFGERPFPSEARDPFSKICH